jgi:hypothetical protein
MHIIGLCEIIHGRHGILHELIVEGVHFVGAVEGQKANAVLPPRQDQVLFRQITIS